MPHDVFVYDALRTPRGKGRNGSLHGVKPITLVVGLLHALQNRNASLDPNRIDDVVLGCVSPLRDQGADIARIAALSAGLPHTVAGVQLNRFCASGLEAFNTAAQKVASGWESLVLAGGVESMSRVPMGSDGEPGPTTLRRTSRRDSFRRASAPISLPPSNISAATTSTPTPSNRRQGPQRHGPMVISTALWCRLSTGMV